MKCGERGWRNAAGGPCGQTIGTKAVGCLHHDPAQKDKARASQSLGGLATMADEGLSDKYPLPKLNNLESYEEASKLLFRLSLKGEVKPWRLREAGRNIQLLLQAETIRAQRELNEALVASERGSPALMALNQYLLQTPSGRRRALTRLTATDVDASA